MGKIVVDRFNVKASLYLLTHAHTDHMRGLRKGWSKGPILCSEETGRVIQALYGVPKSLIPTIAPGEEIKVFGAVIKAYDANHCPGALMFRVEREEEGNDKGKVEVYTGDFRLNDSMRGILHEFEGADVCYLDMTYNNPCFMFPPQSHAIQQVIEVLETCEGKDSFIGIYNIGKNKVVKAVSKHFGVPVYVPERTYRVYQALDMGEIVTKNMEDTCISAYSRGFLEKPKVDSPLFYKISMGYTVIPTGWACIMKPRNRRGRRIEYVAYSEHNDYYELQEFIKTIKPKKIVNFHRRK